MPNIKRITLPTGTTYDLVDQGARDLIEELSNYTSFLGVTTTALTDGSTTNPVTINGQSVTAVTGNIVTYGSAEFIFNGTSWQAFGDLSALGSLAYKNKASGSYTPSGQINAGAPTVTLSTTTVNSIESVGALPSCTLPSFGTSVENETLTLSWNAGAFNAGSLPTKGANTTVATGVQSTAAGTTTFTGTAGTIEVQ